MQFSGRRLEEDHLQSSSLWWATTVLTAFCSATISVPPGGTMPATAYSSPVSELSDLTERTLVP